MILLVLPFKFFPNYSLKSFWLAFALWTSSLSQLVSHKSFSSIFSSLKFWPKSCCSSQFVNTVTVLRCRRRTIFDPNSSKFKSGRPAKLSDWVDLVDNDDSPLMRASSVSSTRHYLLSSWCRTPADRVGHLFRLQLVNKAFARQFY